MAAARGETESFQVVVSAGEAAIAGVRVAIDDFKGPGRGGTSIVPAAAATLYREHYLEVGPNRSYGNRNHPLPPGRYPEPLIPFADPTTGRDLEGAAYDAVPFVVERGRNQPIWVDITVPRDVPAGPYTGACRVTWNGGGAILPIHLEVWNFELPRRPALRTLMGVGSKDRPGIADLLSAHRLMPWDTDLSKAVDRDRRFGLNAIDVGRRSGAGYGHWKMSPPPAPDYWTAVEHSLPQDLRPFLFNFTADEITEAPQLRPMVRDWGRSMHTASSVRNMITMVPFPDLMDDGTGRPAVDIWVVLPNQAYDPEIRTRLGQVMERGCEVWSYTALNPDNYSPKWLVNYDLIDERIYPWINQSYGFKGILYWRVDYWNQHPWVSSVNDVFHLAGEGVLVYPGEEAGLPGRAVPSLRLKALRDGVDDYDYIEILRGLGQGSFASEVVRSVARDWAEWTHDPAALAAARRSLGERIDALMTKPAPAPASRTLKGISSPEGP